MTLQELNTILSKDKPNSYILDKQSIESLVQEQKNDSNHLEGTNFWDALFKNSGYMFQAKDGLYFVHDYGITKIDEMKG